jgi:hypothetical protein
MHTQEEQLAASSGGNPELATEHINSEGMLIALVSEPLFW